MCGWWLNTCVCTCVVGIVLQAQRPKRRGGAGGDGEHVRLAVLRAHGARQPRPLPARRGAAAHEPHAQVIVRSRDVSSLMLFMNWIVKIYVISPCLRSLT